MFCRWRLVTTLRQYCLSTPLVTATIPSVTTSHIVSQSSIQSYRIFHPWSIWSRYLVTSPETAIQNTSDASKPTESSKPSRPKPRQRIEIHINEEDLIEKFVRGSGPGGQKINKTNNCVDLLHVPTGIRIKCQATRSREQNRKEARKLLRRKLDELYNGELSYNAQREAKKIRARARQRKRAAKKYGHKKKEEEEEEADTSTNDDVNDAEECDQRVDSSVVA